MFADAIEIVSGYTRPVKFIMRCFGSKEVVPGTATLFFVNDQGVAITCRHVARELLKCPQVTGRYAQYLAEAASVRADDRQAQIRALAEKYGYRKDSVAQYLCTLYGCVRGGDRMVMSVTEHPDYDLAIIRIQGRRDFIYTGHAVFAEDGGSLRRGDFLCRYGFPFAEFTNYFYDAERDQIGWRDSGKASTPAFPIEGMVTRCVADASGHVYEYEMSTPGLKGQSGGPLFDARGLVFGIQSSTRFLHLGFDQFNAQVRIDGAIRSVENHPFLHVGRCVTVDVIKAFLDRNRVMYYVGDGAGNIRAVNG